MDDTARMREIIFRGHSFDAVFRFLYFSTFGLPTFFPNLQVKQPIRR